MFLLQEFDFEEKDGKRTKNNVDDYLWKLEEEVIIKLEDAIKINDAFFDE